VKDSLLHYDVHGNKGPYLLMVHGWLSSRAQWMPNVGPLSEFCRPVVVELLGHGRSPSPEDPEYYTPQHYVQEFECIRKQLGAEKWFICGQSLGAGLTLRYALTCPGKVIAQVLTNSRAALSEESWDEIMDLVELGLEEKGREVIDTFPLHPSRSRRMAPEFKKALVDAVALVDVQGFFNTGRYTLTNSSVRDIIHGNQVPALLIAGRFDKPFVPYLEIAEKIVPGLEMIMVDGGHAVNIDCADEFNAAVRAFVTRFAEI